VKVAVTGDDRGLPALDHELRVELELDGSLASVDWSEGAEYVGTHHNVEMLAASPDDTTLAPPAEAEEATIDELGSAAEAELPNPMIAEQAVNRALGIR
jgi:hypothetical protein